MDKQEFSLLRKKLNKTQIQMAQLLGTSLKAVHSYEQGWRSIPAHAERQLLFLVSQKNRTSKNPRSCWQIKKCPADRRKQCPAWEFKSGNLCWFISGTMCEGSVHENWKEKMHVCRNCKVFKSQLNLGKSHA